MKNHEHLVAALCIAIGCASSNVSLGNEDLPNRPPYGRQLGMSRAILKSDLLAGFIIAYEDYVAYHSLRGERVDPRWVRERLGAITISLDDSKVSISFGRDHPGFGGSLDYIVDLESMSIVDRKQGR